MYINIFIYTYIYVYECVCVCVCLCVCVCICTHTHTNTHTYIYTYIYIHIYIYIYINIYIHIYLHIYIHIYIYIHVCVCILINFIPFSNDTYSRGHRFKLSINLIRKDVFKQYFIFRCIPVWNILPDHYFNTYITESFKLKLKLILANFYMERYKRELTLVFSLLVLSCMNVLFGCQ